MKFTGLLLLALLALATVSCQKTEKKRRTVGYKGEARSNAFLAAQRLLKKRGHQVVSQNNMGDLGFDTATVFLTPSSLNTVGRSKRVCRWVENGGHLVVMLASGAKRGNDFRMAGNVATYGRDEITPGVQYLLDELGVGVADWSHESTVPAPVGLDRDGWEGMKEKDRVLLGAEKTLYSLGDKPLEIYHWSDEGLRYDCHFANEFGTAQTDGEAKHRYLSLYYGQGRVSLLTDASPFRNRYIGYGDHARFLTELVGLSGDGTIIFTDGGGDNFFSMVWRYFWMAVIGLAVVIVFWLWKNLPRFGPPEYLPQSQVREFSGQVRGIGRFLWRQKRDETMLSSLRRMVNQRLSINAAGDHEGIFEQLAERTGLPVESVIEAMTRNQVREPGVMVRVVKNLQLILKTINKR